jgi:UDP-N-acetylmuramoylalanine-D-glutamate ligase
MRGPRGVTVIDDTMAATPLKVAAAAREAPPGPVVAVLGGDDALGGAPVHASDEERRALADALHAVRARADTVVAFGPARRRIGGAITIDHIADDIDGAVSRALEACPDGGTVLVSPMFPMRPDERERVRALLGG